MALKYPDRIESNNPQAYGIVKATEVSGARNAAEYGGLLDIPDNILSANGDGSDALYLLWIDDNLVCRLIDWNNRHNSKGWQIEYAYIPWDSTAHLNSLTLSGQYYISGQSNGLNGGLPILNSDPGHTFDAVLRVLDSSLTKDENEKLLCITLILSLSNRMGGDGHIFVRTIQTLGKDNLTRTDIEGPTCDKWETWEKLQGVFEKNVATNILEIDTYTTNGMYSVVSGSTSLVSGFLFRTGDTLLIITVNGYHVSKSGFNPQLTQLVYVLPAGRNPNSGAIEYQLSKLITRTALWNVSTKLWDYHNFQDLTDLGRIKEIKVNDIALTIDSNKAINLDLDASYLELGLDSHIAIALKDKNNSSVLKDIKVLMPFADSSKDGLMMYSDKKYLDLLQNKDHFQAITWSTSFNANNYHNGNYRITGIRTSLNDNLPMQNAADGHSIDCYLKVLDSSLKPTDGTNVSEACVTLILMTSNRIGGDGHIYVRTGKASTGGYNNLSWSTWLCLQGIFEKNVVELPVHLNTYTTNGMYSGVFVNPDRVGDLLIKAFDTFLLITVNGYAAAGTALIAGLNKAPQLTQLLYITPIETGLANLYTRTATWDGSLWVFSKFYRLATNEDTDKLDIEISNLLTKNAELDNLIIETKTAAETAQTAAETAQETANSARETATAASTAAQEAKSAAETAQSTANDANTKITELAGKVNGKQDALTLTVKDNGNIVLANIQGQSKEFMPAAPSGDPMHYAFVTAGAEYNDTGADIVKDAPWADLADDDADKTVVHKAGYWYLNGLGDITNEQMQRIYMLTGSNQNYWHNYCNGQDVRTNILTIRDIEEVPTNLISVVGGLRRCNIEVLKVWAYERYKDISVPYFNLIYVEKLKFIIGVFKASNNMSGSYIGNLKGIKIFGIKGSVKFTDAKNLSMKSVLYMINNEAATSPITITLHADVYNRCMANEDILAALAAHTNISIARA